MKKAIIIIVIFSIIAISFTATMISVNNKKIPASTSYKENAEVVIHEDISTQLPMDPLPEQENDNNTKEEYIGIILGKSTYNEVPIEFDRNSRKISGLLNKEVQSKINDSLKHATSIDFSHSFSNVISISNYYNSEFYNYNLINGEELTLDDYFYNKSNIKNILSKRIVAAIYKAFKFGSNFYLVFNNSSVDLDKYNEQKAALDSFGPCIEAWQNQIIKRFDNGKYSFGFDESTLYLLFDNVNFESPVGMYIDYMFESHFGEEYEHPLVKDLKITIPLYDIYKYVSIFDKYAHEQDLYENAENIQQKFVLCDDIFNSSFINIDDKHYEMFRQELLPGRKATTDEIISRFKETASSYGIKDPDSIEPYLEDWNQKCEELQKSNKITFAYNNLCKSMTYGIMGITTYVTCDEDSSQDKIQDILCTFIKSHDVEWESMVIDMMKIQFEELKKIYPDLDFNINTTYFSR